MSQTQPLIDMMSTVKAVGRDADASFPTESDRDVGILARALDQLIGKYAGYSDAKFKLAVEACPYGMVMVDEAGGIVLVNAATERLFGYSRAELIGQPVEVLVPNRSRALHVRHRDSFETSPATRCLGSMRGRKLFGLRKDGTEFAVDVGLSPIHLRDERFTLSVIVDVTERDRVEGLKNEFVSTVSHELRTPLTSIAASLGLLSSGAAGALGESAMKLLTIAHSNSQRLVRLINDILDIEKMESGEIVFDLKPVDVPSVAEQVIEANHEFAAGLAVRLRVAAVSPAAVLADADRLVQVLTNLVSNAVKFSPNGGEVTVGIETIGEIVRISVRDHGSGIPASFKPHVFDKFAQAEGLEGRRKGGSGLGLSIVKQIVERLNGTVGFHDAPGGGTVFFVELPSFQPGRDAEAMDSSGQRVNSSKNGFPAGFAAVGASPELKEDKVA